MSTGTILYYLHSKFRVEVLAFNSVVAFDIICANHHACQRSHDRKRRITGPGSHSSMSSGNGCPFVSGIVKNKSAERIDNVPKIMGGSIRETSCCNLFALRRVFFRCSSPQCPCAVLQWNQSTAKPPVNQCPLPCRKAFMKCTRAFIAPYSCRVHFRA